MRHQSNRSGNDLYAEFPVVPVNLTKIEYINSLYVKFSRIIKLALSTIMQSCPIFPKTCYCFDSF